ncbi:hypothetical protein GGI07_004869 [Coemansia sp. Benny D115]|nr:hypothetical protein GGI07_004869 [Coemansia sp. Benny D115]
MRPTVQRISAAACRMCSVRALGSVGVAANMRAALALPAVAALHPASIPGQQQHQQVQMQVQMQRRFYGSKKKGGKKGGKKEADEGDSDPVELTLDMAAMEERMRLSVEHFAQEMKNMRLGRADPSLMDHIKIKLKSGSAMLPKLAMVAVKDAHNLIVVPNDEENLKVIDASIRSAGLGLNPLIEKKTLVVPVPKLTKQSREQLPKSLGLLTERSRVAVREHRQVAMKQLKNDSARAAMPQNEVNALKKDIQAATDKHIARIEELAKSKAREIEKI